MKGIAVLEEQVKVKPTLDSASTRTMFDKLNGRFADVAKKFGKGLKTALNFTPLLAIAGAVLAKILAPLEKAEQLLDRVLAEGADAKDLAEEVGTDEGTLKRFQYLGAAKGVDTATMNQLLLRYQTAIAQERENARKEQEALNRGEKPETQPGILREFISEKDTVNSLFQFMQSLQHLEKDQRTLIQTQIFGERARGRLNALFNERDYGRILTRAPSGQELGKAVNKAADLDDRRTLERAVIDAQTFLRGTAAASPGAIDLQVAEYRREQNKAVEQLQGYVARKSADQAMNELLDRFNKLADYLLNTFAPEFAKFVTKITGWMDSAKVWGTESWGTFKTWMGGAKIQADELNQKQSEANMNLMYGPRGRD